MALSTRGLEDPSVFHQHARSAVDRMKGENAQMLKDLVADTRRLRQAKGSGLAIANEKVQQDISALNRSMEAEKKRIGELHQEVQHEEDAMMTLKKRIGGVNAPVENSRALRRHVQKLEARIIHAHQRYDKAVADNRHTISRIGTLRRERVIFDTVYRKLEAELQRKREAMQEVLGAAERAYRAREAAQGRISRLRAEATEEGTAFDRKWRHAARRLEHVRAEKQSELAALRALGEERVRLGITTGPEEAEQEARAKMARGRWTVTSNRMTVEAHEDRMAQFQQTMNTIREESGIETMDELVRRFKEVEDRKYSLFNHAGQLATDIDRTEALVAEARREVDELEEEAQRRHTRTGRARVVAGLKQRRDKDTERANELEAAAEDRNRELARLREGIGALFATVDGGKSSLAQSLTESEVTSRNAMQHLGIVEQRLLELVRAYQAAPSSEGEERRMTFRHSLPARTCNVAFSVHPPAVTDLADQAADEDGERPLNRAELAERVSHSLGSLAGVSAPSLAGDPNSGAQPVDDPPPPRVYTVELSRRSTPT